MNSLATLQGAVRQAFTHYDRLPQRQRTITASIIGLLGIGLIYFLLIQPALQFSQRAKANIEQEKTLLAYMQEHADQIRQINAARKAKTGQDTSLLALASSTAAEHHLTLQRFEPNADGKLAVWLSQVEFNSLLSWLDQLVRQYNIQIERLNISQSDKPALVEAQIVLR